jgi:hypothetical protein
MASAAARAPQSSHTNSPTSISATIAPATSGHASARAPIHPQTRGGTSSPRRRAARTISMGNAAPTRKFVTTPEIVRTLANEASPTSRTTSATEKTRSTGVNATSARVRRDSVRVRRGASAAAGKGRRSSASSSGTSYSLKGGVRGECAEAPGLDEDRACRRARHRLLLGQPEAEVFTRRQPRVLPITAAAKAASSRRTVRPSSSAQWLMS